MAKAEAARDAEALEKAKRQAQRSKRVAGFIIDPKKLEETKVTAVTCACVQPGAPLLPWCCCLGAAALVLLP